jgi:hypothetical protein
MVKSSNASIERDLKAYYHKERALKEVETEIKRVTHGSRKLFDTIPFFLRDKVPKHLRPWDWPEGRGGFEGNTEQIEQIEDSAAVRIQAVYRGKQTRRHMRRARDVEEEKAALRIQAQVRYRSSKQKNSKQAQQAQAQAGAPESPTAASMYSERSQKDQTVADAEAGADDLAAKAAALRAALVSNENSLE